MVEAKPYPEIVASKDHDMLEPQEPPTMDISRKTKPAWVRESYKKQRDMELHKDPQEQEKDQSHILVMQL